MTDPDTRIIHRATDVRGDYVAVTITDGNGIRLDLYFDPTDGGYEEAELVGTLRLAPDEWADQAQVIQDALQAHLATVEPQGPLRDAWPHNLIAHPLLVLCPRLGRWAHDRTEPLAPPLTRTEFAWIIASVAIGVLGGWALGSTTWWPL